MGQPGFFDLDERYVSLRTYPGRIYAASVESFGQQAF